MCFVVLLSLCLGVVHGYSGGAPPSTCASMFPNHYGIQARSEPAPFSFQLSKQTYGPGEVISVNLVGNGATLKGYIIQARDSNQNVVGQFQAATGGRTLNCGVVNGAITHTSPSAKSGISFTWSAPDSSVGNIYFLATAVQTFDSFWVNIQSSPLTPRVLVTSPPPTTTTTTTTTTPAPQTMAPTTKILPKVTTTMPASSSTPAATKAPSDVTTTVPTQETPAPGMLTMDDLCGETKGCFVSCKSADCDYIVTWKDGQDYVDFEVSSKLQATTNHWIAIAFSSDLLMGMDDVVDCISDGSTVKVVRSYNDGKSNLPVDTGSQGISRASGSYKDGIFSCKFRRAKSESVTRRKRQATKFEQFDLNEKWYLMFGHGPAMPGFVKMMHKENPVVTPSRVDFQSADVIGDTAKYPLIKVHAILMIIAWILCTGVGVVAARYYKPVWTTTNIMGQKVWFQIHRTCMVTAFVLTIIGFIIVFVQVQGYSQIPSITGKEYLKAHPPLGIIVTILAIINPIMSIFRPGPKDEKRPIFNWAHWGVGVLAHVLSVVTICFGIEMKKSTAPSYSVWVVIGYVIYHIIMEVILKSFDVYLNKGDNGRVDALAMTNTGASPQNGTQYKVPPPAYSERDKQKSPKDSIVKKLLLAFHMAIALAFTVTLVLLVAMYD